MSETNKQFVKQILEFETNLQRNDKIIEDMKKDTEKGYGQRIASDILHTVFTPDQETDYSDTETNHANNRRYFICYCPKIEEWKGIQIITRSKHSQ